MTTRAASAISIDRNSDTPLYRQIATQLMKAMASGDLERDDRLPTTRRLAQDLGVNRLTVARAYDELARAGMVSPEVGRGTFVRRVAQARSGGVARGAPPEAHPSSMAWRPLFARASDRAVEEGLPPAASSATARGAVSFASLFPDPALFPVEALRRAMDGVLRRQGRSILGYGPPAGHPPLRALLAEEMRAKGMDVSAEEVVITNGSQQGIDLVARALLDPGDTVLVENPTYTGAVQVFHSFGAQLVGIPVDGGGMSVSRFGEAIERRRPKLIYLIPNFQNPTSETMDLSRRRELTGLARERGLAILEDDFGGALRYEGEDLPALKALDSGGNVIYISTYAKKLLPGLRLGWIAARRELVERIVQLKKITDYSTSLLMQAALLEFCARGDLDRHLAAVVDVYRRRRDAMLAAMGRWFPSGVSWTRPEGGLAIWVTLPGGIDADEVAADAENRGVLVGRGDLFHVDGGSRHNLRLTFSQADPRMINKGIRILGEIIRSKIGARHHGGARTDDVSLPII